MKKLLFIFIGLFFLASCSNDNEQIKNNQTDLSQRESNDFYKDAWYHSDGDLVMPIQPKDGNLTLFMKFNFLDNKIPQDVTGAVFYTDSLCVNRSTDYWYCGGGVYTNGNPAQNYTVTYYEGPWAIMNAPWPYTIVYDEFADHVYAYTSRWGGVCP